jgi:hypothetical protein
MVHMQEEEKVGVLCLPITECFFLHVWKYEFVSVRGVIGNKKDGKGEVWH